MKTLLITIALMASVSAHAAQPEEYQASPGCAYLIWYSDQNQWYWVPSGIYDEGDLFCEPDAPGSVKCVDGSTRSMRIENDIVFFEGYELPKVDDVVTGTELTCKNRSAST